MSARQNPFVLLPLAARFAQADNGAVQVRASIAAVSVLLLCIAAPAHPVPAHRPPGTAQAAHAVPPPEERIDINHASLQELMTVPGMTHSWAGRIVRFRPYRAKNELFDRGILPGDVYLRIKDFVIAHRQKP